MKLLSTFVFLLTFYLIMFSKLLAQSPLNAYNKAVIVYDTVTLKTSVLSNEKWSVKNKLNTVNIAIQQGSAKQDSLKELKIKIEKIDSLINFLNSPFTKKPPKINVDGNGKLALQSVSGIASVFNISTAYQSLVIDAVAKIVAEEFKEGITTMYLNKFRDRMNKIPGAKDIFPKTFDLLNSDNIFHFNSIGQEFKTAFDEDLKNTIPNFTQYLEDSVGKSKNSPALFVKFKQSEFYQPFLFSSDAGDKLLKGYHFTQLLSYLVTKYDSLPQYKDYYLVTKLVDILQYNLQDLERQEKNTQLAQIGSSTNNQTVWLNFNKVKTELLYNPKKVQLFLAFIYWDNQVFFDTNYPTFKTDASNPVKFFREKIIPLLDLLSKTDNYLNKGKVEASDYNEIIQLALDVIKLINTYPNTPFLKPNAIEISQKVIDIHKTVLKRDYSAVIPNVVFILNKVKDSSKTAATMDTSLVIFTNFLMRYGPFVVGVVNAKTSDELKDVLKKAIAPSGSYEAKRNSLSSITLTAYPGLIGGYETLANGKPNWQPNLGFTTPIGLEFMWGIRGERKVNRAEYVTFKDKKTDKVKALTGHSLGLMLSIIDIGAAVNYRLNEPDKELPSEINFAQVFSPGVAVHWGVKNTPITIGAGYQYTPQLRKISSTDQDLSNASRVYLRATWDVSLVNLFLKTEKRR